MDALTAGLALVGDFLTALAALFALFGISAWRRGFIGQRKIELAEDTLRLFYQVQDAIRIMRSPFSSGLEAAEIILEEGETNESFAARKLVAPLLKRASNHSALFAELQSTRYRFMARFGGASTKPFDDIRLLINRLKNSANMLVICANDADGLDKNNPEDLAKIKEHRSLYRDLKLDIWETSELDHINVQLRKIVSDVEQICEPLLKRQDWTDRLRAWWTAPVGKIR